MKKAERQAKNMLESLAKTQGQKVEIEIPKEKDFFKNLRNKAKSALSALRGKSVKNLQNGIEASVSSDGISKMISVNAVDKSLKNGYTKEEHFASVENVLKLYEISNFIESEAPRNKSADVVAYHKFIANFRINHKN